MRDNTNTDKDAGGEDDILQEHLRAVEGACAYRSDGWFHARLKARMDAMARESAGMSIPRPAWLLGALVLLLALNLWTVRSSVARSDERSDSLRAFLQAYDTSIDTVIE